MNSKKYTRITLSVSVTLLLLFSLIMFLIDPFFQYHNVWFGLKPTPTYETYENPGMLKNFEYDSVITGSSMVQNFRASWFNTAFDCNAIKTTYAGGSLKNFYYVFDLAFANKHRQVKNIFYGLDIYALSHDSQKTRILLPMYLYDNTPLNDIPYLLNKDTMLSVCSKMIMDRWFGIGNQPDFDDIYVWEQHYSFSEEDVLKTYSRPQITPPNNVSQALTVCQKNLDENLIPFIRDNPNTQFYIFFPPYSILFWDTTMRQGNLNPTFAMLEYCMEKLLEYDNVKIFYFQNIETIVTNLDNYKDYTHYSTEINKYMIDCMVNGTHQMTKDNYMMELMKMRTLAENFNFEELF